MDMKLATERFFSSNLAKTLEARFENGQDDFFNLGDACMDQMNDLQADYAKCYTELKQKYTEILDSYAIEKEELENKLEKANDDFFNLGDACIKEPVATRVIFL